MKLRNARPDDIDSLNELLSAAVAEPDVGEDGGFVPPRSRRLLNLFLAGHPDAAFVLEDGKRIGGLVFGRLWGRTGWIGPLALEPSLRGQGHGGRLLERAEDSLRRAGATVIGTEVPLSHAGALGFFAARGYKPMQPSLDLERRIEGEEGVPGEGGEAAYFSSQEGTDRDRFLEDVRLLSASLDADLDYRPEVELAVEHRMGDSILFRKEGRPVGLAVCHTRPYAEEGEAGIARLTVLALEEGYPYPSLDAVLHVVGLLALEARLRSLVVPLPGRHWEALRALIALGYRAGPVRLRMTLLGYPERGEARRLNLARWS